MNALAISLTPAVVSKHAAEGGCAGRKRRQRQRRPQPVLAPPGVGGVERYRIETGQVPPWQVPSPGLEERSLLGAVLQRLVNPHTPGRHSPMCIHGSTWLGGRCWKCPTDADWSRRTAADERRPLQEEEPQRARSPEPESTDLERPQSPSTRVITGGVENATALGRRKAQGERKNGMQPEAEPPPVRCDV